MTVSYRPAMLINGSVIGLLVFFLSGCQLLSSENNSVPANKVEGKVEKPASSWFSRLFNPHRQDNSANGSARAVAELTGYFSITQKFSQNQIKKEIRKFSTDVSSVDSAKEQIRSAYLFYKTGKSKQFVQAKKILRGIINDKGNHQNYRHFSRFLLTSISKDYVNRQALIKTRRSNKKLQEQLDALTIVEEKINERSTTYSSNEQEVRP